MFVEQFVQAINKENLKDKHYMLKYLISNVPHLVYVQI